MSRNVQKKWTFIGKWKHLETFGNIWKPNTYYPHELFLGTPILINMVTKNPLKLLKCIKIN